MKTKNTIAREGDVDLKNGINDREFHYVTQPTLVSFISNEIGVMPRFVKHDSKSIQVISRQVSHMFLAPFWQIQSRTPVLSSLRKLKYVFLIIYSAVHVFFTLVLAMHLVKLFILKENSLNNLSEAFLLLSPLIRNYKCFRRFCLMVFTGACLGLSMCSGLF